MLPNKIAAVLSAKYGESCEAILKGRSRKQPLADLKHVLRYSLFMEGMTTPEISEYLEVTRASVINSVSKVKERLSVKETSMQEMVESVSDIKVLLVAGKKYRLHDMRIVTIVPNPYASSRKYPFIGILDNTRKTLTFTSYGMYTQNMPLYNIKEEV